MMRQLIKLYSSANNTTC